MGVRDLPALIDADAHVLEPNDLWSRVPEAWRERAPAPGELPPLQWGAPGDAELLAEMLIARAGGGEQAERSDSTLRELCYAGAPVYDAISDELWKRGSAQMLAAHGKAALAGFQPETVIADLKAQHVDRAHMFPTAGLWVLAIDGMEPGLAAALSRTYNDWIAQWVAHDPDLLRPVGLVSLHDPAAAAAEVERVADRGFTAVMVRPNPIGGRFLGDPSHETFFAACERRGVALAVHEGTHARQPAAGRERYHTRFGRHACSHPFEQAMAFLSLLESGTLERHPGLRVGFMEAGCAWLPYWLWRLDHIEYDNLAWEVEGRVTMRPSEYFRRQCWVSCEASEPMLEQVVHEIGADRVLYGSDYPHIDHDGAIESDAETLIERLGLDTAAKVFDANPRAFYGD